MGFLKTILIILLVYYFLKILGKLFAPRMFRYAAKKTEEHFKEKFEGFAEQNNSNEEQIGDVIIENKTAKKKNTSKNVGEYIDFEEIE
tara:strand:+ start:6887 stop:7150 length:264 start_codon:yes stop_codon:yes gene_type:complete